MSTQFNNGQEVFYHNKKCTFVCMLDSGDAVVEFPHTYETYEGEVNTEYDRMIVHTRWLRDRQIKFDEEYQLKIQQMQSELSKMERDKTTEINKKLSDAEQKLKSIEIKLKQYHHLSQFVDYLNGKTKYAVTEGYNPKISEISELIYEESRYTKRLRAFVIKRANEDKVANAEFEFRISDYSDGSGSGDRSTIFENKEEAVKKFTEVLLGYAREKSSSGYCSYISEDTLLKWEIKDPYLWQMVEKNKEYDRKKKMQEIAELENKIKKARSESI